MGYTTDFRGSFKLDRPMTQDLQDYLLKFARTRRMARKMDPKYGVEGEFYVDASGQFGQDRDSTIIDYNSPPETQPGLWCQWVPTEDGTGIEWDGGEKFYSYIEWLEYIIKNFLAPEDYVLNGRVFYQGEESSDFGAIVVVNNLVRKVEGNAFVDAAAEQCAKEMLALAPYATIDAEVTKVEKAGLTKDDIITALADVIDPCMLENIADELTAPRMIQYSEYLRSLARVQREALAQLGKAIEKGFE